MTRGMKWLVAFLVVLIILIIGYYAFEQGWANKFLPAKWRKTSAAPRPPVDPTLPVDRNAPPGVVEGFRGAQGRSPAMTHCFLPNPNASGGVDWRNPYNACMHV